MLVPAIAQSCRASTPKTVFVVEDGVAQQRTVVTGTRLEDRVQILAGLQAGDVVVTSGVLQISAGQRVRTIGTAQVQAARDPR